MLSPALTWLASVAQSLLMSPLQTIVLCRCEPTHADRASDHDPAPPAGPEDVNWSQHRIASTKQHYQHSIRMATK